VIFAAVKWDVFPMSSERYSYQPYYCQLAPSKRIVGGMMDYLFTHERETCRLNEHYVWEWSVNTARDDNPVCRDCPGLKVCSSGERSRARMTVLVLTTVNADVSWSEERAPW
jgi:hypothetical protein